MRLSALSMALLSMAAGGSAGASPPGWRLDGADARIRELLVVDVVQLPLIMKVNRLTWVDEEHRMFIVFPRLQVLDGVVALRNSIRPI